MAAYLMVIRVLTASLVQVVDCTPAFLIVAIRVLTASRALIASGKVVVCGWLVYAGHSHTMPYLDLFLRLIASGLLVVLIVLIIKRKLHTEFPFFLAYISFSILANASGQIASSHPVGYFIVYWSTEAILAVLALLVLREIFDHVLSVQYQAFPWMRLLLPATVIMILVISIYHGLHSSAANSKILYLTQMIHWFDFGVHAFQAGLLVLLIVVCSLFSVPWLRYEFGIIIGFGINAVFTMAADLLWVEYGSSVALFSRYGPPAGYILATLMWLLAFSAPAKQVSKSEYTEKEMLELLREQWRTLAIIRKWLRRNRSLLLSR